MLTPLHLLLENDRKPLDAVPALAQMGRNLLHTRMKTGVVMPLPALQEDQVHRRFLDFFAVLHGQGLSTRAEREALPRGQAYRPRRGRVPDLQSWVREAFMAMKLTLCELAGDENTARATGRQLLEKYLAAAGPFRVPGGDDYERIKKIRHEPQRVIVAADGTSKKVPFGDYEAVKAVDPRGVLRYLWREEYVRTLLALALPADISELPREEQIRCVRAIAPARELAWRPHLERNSVLEIMWRFYDVSHHSDEEVWTTLESIRGELAVTPRRRLLHEAMAPIARRLVDIDDLFGPALAGITMKLLGRDRTRMAFRGWRVKEAAR